TCTIDIAGVPLRAAIASPGATPAAAAADPGATADTTTAPAVSTASVTPSAASRGNGPPLACGHARAALNERTPAAKAAHACRLIIGDPPRAPWRQLLCMSDALLGGRRRFGLAQKPI